MTQLPKLLHLAASEQRSAVAAWSISISELFPQSAFNQHQSWLIDNQWAIIVDQLIWTSIVISWNNPRFSKISITLQVPQSHAFFYRDSYVSEWPLFIVQPGNFGGSAAPFKKLKKSLGDVQKDMFKICNSYNNVEHEIEQNLRRRENECSWGGLLVLSLSSSSMRKTQRRGSIYVIIVGDEEVVLL